MRDAPSAAHDEGAALALRARKGDGEAKEALLRTHGALLRSLSRRLTGGTVSEELVQAGAVGLLRAAERYDPAQGARFSTYALPWALGEMRRALRRALDETGAYARRRQIARQEEALRAALGRSPSFRELADACRLPDWLLVRALSRAQPMEEAQRGGELPAAEIDLRALDLRLALSSLDADARRIILLRYFRDMTQQETARLLGKSQAQVSRIERRALDLLRERLR